MSNATPPIGYEVKFQRIGVEGGADLQIRSLLDKQQFDDPLGLALDAGISSATWPLFGLVWPSAQKLADLMQTWELTGKRVLEVGCGLGLASLVVHRREGNITASDCHPLTETFLKANVSIHLPRQCGHGSHLHLFPQRRSARQSSFQTWRGTPEKIGA